MLALAPMQDVTSLEFWRVWRAMAARTLTGRNTSVSTAIRGPTSGFSGPSLKTPPATVIAQLIGNNIPALVHTARALQQFPVAAIELNLGCPAPVVYRKCAGGGLLREPQKIDASRRVARRGDDSVHRENTSAPVARRVRHAAAAVREASD